MKIKITTSLLLSLFFMSVLLSCNSTTKNTTQTETTTTSVKNTGNAESYSSKMTKSDKKKYYDSNDNVVYEIKYKPDGFKLRTASSQLLWKIKLYDNKVKISDNEENLNPYEIKLGGTYVAKLVKNEEDLARTAYDLETKQQTIASPGDAQPDFYSTSYSPSLLVNRIPEIAEDQKQILIKELKAKGY
ncbi:hypothetical protein [Lacinutrix salivirga]